LSLRFASVAQVSSPQSDLSGSLAFQRKREGTTRQNPDFALKNTTFVECTIYLNVRYLNLA
jgi:hypothetical protein